MACCPVSHLVCLECFDWGLAVAVGERRALRCFVSAKCSMEYYAAALQRSSDETLRVAYDKMMAEIVLRQVDGVEECGKCGEYFMLVDGDGYRRDGSWGRLMSCDNCHEYSCLMCKGDFHKGLCPIPHLSPAQMAAEKATEGVILRCSCGIAILRGNGCNQVTCLTEGCGLHWCWICKEELDPLDAYSHFKEENDEDGCALYGERPSSVATCRGFFSKTGKPYTYRAMAGKEYCGYHRVQGTEVIRN
ncbi:hypothetical protein BDK51DRAFT_34180 [Blyttiomyces helicus]|uniref:IBR domain-containing protein n=1 Tax=Blyttiomyces helicus TaxID=388810 RepID=A0A4P9VY55_9FUNG|nr:hypothetical protein BDK51DRAFT_34180 [Blyttiomyces helicus]|eukprot:RKO83240.1 hypothetical protein BDK51DRAFT_34180 [Blyttiomyces helicus]